MPPAKNKVDNCSQKSFYFQKKNQFKVLKKHLKCWKTFDNWSQVAASIKSLDISEFNVKKFSQKFYFDKKNNFEVLQNIW